MKNLSQIKGKSKIECLFCGSKEISKITWIEDTGQQIYFCPKHHNNRVPLIGEIYSYTNYYNLMVDEFGKPQNASSAHLEHLKTKFYALD